MKFFIVVVHAVVIASGACKSQTSVSTHNSVAKPPPPSASPGIASPEPTSNCSLGTAPALNGLKLRMTAEEVLAVFPGSKNDPELDSQLKQPASPLGVSTFVVRPERLKPNKFPAFSQFTFTLLDRRVSSLNIGYKGPAYSHVDQFVSKLVEGTNLPPVDEWQPYTGMENQLKILKCKSFEVRVFVGGNGGDLNYVLLTDLDAAKRLKDRRATARAQSTPAATP